MKFINKWALALVPGLALAMPALALNPPQLADVTQPGSVIVFPKFAKGQVHVTSGSGTSISVAQTEIEIGAVCPRVPVGATSIVTCGPFTHNTVIVHFHWVCGAQEALDSSICHETDFSVTLSTNGKLAFSADGIAINGNSPGLVPPAPCARGYLIGWVVDSQDRPIRFDGLIGNAVIRGGDLPPLAAAGLSQAVSAFSAITIQAAEGAAAPAVGATLTMNGLQFDGTPGHYTAISGKQFADVKFDRTVSAPPPAVPQPDVLSKTALVFLTLDVESNRTNTPTWIDLAFYNESLNTVSGTNPNFEHLTSDSVEIICWGQVPLSSLAGGALTQVFQNTRKGIVIAGPAEDDNGVLRTLIGLVETIEGTTANLLMERKYNFNMSNDLTPVPTTFFP